MKIKNGFVALLVIALLVPAAIVMMAMSAENPNSTPPKRPEGPCDIYAAGNTPCVAAHSTTRALYASYNGPLYQIMRQSDGKTLDITIVAPTNDDPGGYANSAAQDAFCANTYCWITKIYDQSGHGNDLAQAPRGGFSGPAMGGFNNLPVADMAPATLMGHKVYGVFIEPGMGLRNDDAKGTAVDDQAEGQYWVINGHHYNSGCCYDYGNAETDSRDDGDGTMETTYYGNATPWYHGKAPGPWVMTDQENNLVGCVNPSPNDKACPYLPNINWRFVTAMADGEPHHWRSMGGDAQQGDLQVMFDGTRVINDRSSYDPMRKQGAILLGNGGDNSNGSQGTFYEGAMTAAGTFPSKETDQKIQANVVAARYERAPLSVAPANATDMPPGLQTFSQNSSQQTTLTFVNTTGAPVAGLVLSIEPPKNWKAVLSDSKEPSKKFSEPLAPGKSVSATFTVTSGAQSFNGDLAAKASWNNSTGKAQSETSVEKVRNVSPLKINEFRVATGSPDNETNSFIELYNGGNAAIDVSNWTLTYHPTQIPIFSSIKIPAGTKLPAHRFYLLGLSNSGLAVPSKKGASSVYVRLAKGMSAGDKIQIGTGANKEVRTITDIVTPAKPETNASSRFARFIDLSAPTTIWQPLPEGPVITIPRGSTNIPVTSVAGFQVGQKMAIGYGATYPAVSRSKEKYEIVTITKVGKPGTQAYLSVDAKAGSTNIKVSSVENISVGDQIRLDIDSKSHGIETVTVTKVGTKSVRGPGRGPLADTEDPGTGLELAQPLKFNHSANIPFSVKGTGISFEPATAFDHSSNEPVLFLGNIVKLDKPLSNNHEINDVVRDEKVTTSGYQGDRQPDEWFGGPALAASAGSMVLRDGAGNVVDGLNYGTIVDPWLAEGYQGVSGSGKSGNHVSSPGTARRFRFGSSVNQANRSAGRFPDGFDTDDNLDNFHLQTSVSLAAASAAGADDIKVSSVSDFTVGEKVFIGAGTNRETGIITKIGAAGGTTLASPVDAGKTLLLVKGIEGFKEGESISIGAGANREIVNISSVHAVRRRFRNPAAQVFDSINVTMPLKYAHSTDAQVSGSGITLSSPLTKMHEIGTQVASGVPTPGAPNEYAKKP